ncbi:MAG: DUF4835 family protein [Flavobacterium sp.]|nr:DUF4835 family protein [Flavobacterium sp.]
MRKILLFAFLCVHFVATAQELDCKVVVDYSKITNANTQIFKNLEVALNDFVNKTNWTDRKFQQNEKISCAMIIVLNEYNSNNFSASIQVQSSRPVYNSSYVSPVLNINDKDFNFKYIEFENINYNPNSFDSNLVSTLAFYANLIIGMDAETFVANSGTDYFNIAQNIVSVAAQSGYKGWSQSDGNQNRFFIINDILSPTFRPFRQTMTDYHTSLDGMTKDVKNAKLSVEKSIQDLGSIYSLRPNALVTRLFFDAKSDEIISIFSGGPAIPISELVNTLNKISPLNSAKWSQIKM